MVNVRYAKMERSDFDKSRFWSDLDSYMGQGICPEGIKKVLEFGVFDDSELTSMYDKLERGFVSALRKCFPGDAFDHLKGMDLVMKERAASASPVEKRIGLEEVVADLEPDGFVNKVSNISDGEVIDAEEGRKYFRRYSWNGENNRSGHPREEAVLSKMLKFISQSLLQSYQKKDSQYKAQAVEMAKVLTYLVKAKESGHYYCSDELEEVKKRFSVNRLF